MCRKGDPRMEVNGFHSVGVSAEQRALEPFIGHE
jgi:hypothetical protein